MSLHEGSLASKSSTGSASSASSTSTELAKLTPLPASQGDGVSSTVRDVTSTSPRADDSLNNFTSSSNANTPSPSAHSQASNSSSTLPSPPKQVSSSQGLSTGATTPSAQSPNSNSESSPIPPSPAPRSSRWSRIKRRLISERLESMLMLVVALGGWLTAIVALLPSLASREIAEWTAAKDFREQCRQDKQELNLSTPECESVLKRILPYPPSVSKNIFKDLGKRWLDRKRGVSDYSIIHSNESAPKPLPVLLGILYMTSALTVAVLVLKNWGRIIRRWKLWTPLNRNTGVGSGYSDSMLPSYQDISRSDSWSTAVSRDLATRRAPATLRNRKDDRKSRTHQNLVEAVVAGDRNDVERRLMDKSIGVEEKCDALVAAAENNDLEIAELLLAQGLDLNHAFRENGESTLIRVVGATSSWTLVKRFLDLGGDITSPGNGKAQILNRSILHKAATLGGNEVVLKMLLKKVDVNYRSPRGWTALHVAAGRAKPDVLKVLLEGGADVNLPTQLGLPPLHVAVRADPLVKLEELWKGLESGPDFDRRTRGLADMRATIRRDKETVIRLLLDHGANIDGVDNDHWTALHHASALGDVPAIESLVEHGANLDLEDRDFNQALHFAVMENHKAAVVTLLKLKANANQARELPFTVLELALRFACEDIISSLLDRRPKPPVTGTLSRELPREEFPRAAAAILRYWTNAGPDVIKEQTKGTSWLHIVLPWVSCREGSELLELLLAQRPDLEFLDSQGRTPLLAAVTERYDYAAKLLLRDGAETEARDISGQTPLHLAARAYRRPIVGQLLAHNANVNAQDSDGVTGLILIGMAVSFRGNWIPTEIQETLSTELTLASSREANINHWTHEGMTILHYAMCYPRSRQIIECLVHRGINLDTQCKNGVAPIHCFAAHGRPANALPELTKINVDAQCFDGPLRLYGPVWDGNTVIIPYRGRDTALHVAVRCRHIGHVRALLSDGGANANLRNQLGHTPLHLAMFRFGTARRLWQLRGQLSGFRKSYNAAASFLFNEELKELDECGIGEARSSFEERDPTKSTEESLLLRRLSEKLPYNERGTEIEDESLAEDIAAALIRFGADVDMQCCKGNTPLHLAARFGVVERCQLLLVKGAKTDILNCDGRTAVEEAQQHCEYAAEKMILSGGKSPESIRTF